MVVLDDEQHIEPAKEDGIDVEEVHCSDRLGLGGQELLPAGGCTARCRVDSGFLEDLPDGGGRDLVSEAGQFAADPPVASGRVVAGHLQHKQADRRASTGPSGLPMPVGPVAPDQLGVPAQERAGSDDQGQLAAARGGQPPGEGGHDRPVGPMTAGGDLAWRCRTAIWWRSTRISVFLTSSERGSRASRPLLTARRSGKASGRSRELIVPESRLAPLPFALDQPGAGIPGQVRVTRFPEPTGRESNSAGQSRGRDSRHAQRQGAATTRTGRTRGPAFPSPCADASMAAPQRRPGS